MRLETAGFSRFESGFNFGKRRRAQEEAMQRVSTSVTVMAFAGAMLSAILGAQPAQQEGWTIPPTAKTEKNPVAASADAAKKGHSTFMNKCRRCHGPEGKGNGPEADPKYRPADLTQIKHDTNPDGVLFYKIYNGHQPRADSKGSMPAFKVQLTRDEIWQVLEYVKTLH
jgi:mono/diheme cytochrome c family protein